MALSKAEFDHGLILDLLPDGYNYSLDTWDVMGESRFFVEGRVQGEMNSSGVKQWLEEFYQSSSADFNQMSGRRDIVDDEAEAGQLKFR